MPYAKEIVENVVVMETTSSDNYVPDMMKAATDLLRLITAGVEKDENGVRVGMPQVIQQMRVKGYETLKTLTATFSVNGATVPFDSETTGMQLYTLYKEECARQSEAHRQSPEGIKQAEERAQRVVDNQAIVDAELSEISNLMLAFTVQKAGGARQPIGELAKRLFASLARLIDAGDHTGVRYDKEHIQRMLCNMGYQNNEYVGRGDDIVCLESWRAYVAGQIINCLRPESFSLLPPFAAFKIRERGLDTDTLIPGK